MRFENRSAVVTGGASGIGLATVRRLAREGARVHVVDADGEALRRSAGALAAEGLAVSIHTADVRDATAAARIVDAARADTRWLDVLVTAAGISRGRALVDTDDASWEEVMAVNATGTFVWLRAGLAVMLAQGSGAAVTVASQLAIAGGRSNAAYIASKGAVVSLTRTAALECAGRGVRVNAVAPGATETPLLARSMARHADPADARERSRARHAMGRFGRPEEIAAAIAYLASDEAAFTTGVVLPVDGGWLVA